ncbi:MAG: fructose 1,6-bisphosphatase [Methanomassiliicoccales archaeon]|jgi:fructose 1,6-bisphosphate aldolase/phosphatase|nr:fructose 1,6-bisphosphatase [Methanomassiliicoccales archaeon]
MANKVTVSVIKADVGSVAGHSRPHPKMMEKCRETLMNGVKAGVIEDFYVTRVGDDINLFMSHRRGENNKEVHHLAWEAFQEAAKIAKDMRLYAAGQDILKDAFSGNVRGAGPGAAEMEFTERPSEPVLFFMADKTEPSSFSLPLTRIFMDPFTTTGLVIDPRVHLGFKFEIVDVYESKKIIMSAPEESYDILSLLGDTTRYAIKRVYSKIDEIGIAAVVSTEKLNFAAGKYVGKDDPVMIVRCQSGLPAVGEVLQPFMFPQLVAGWMRGSHYGAWYPCSVEDSDPSFFDGPPRIVCLGFQISNGRFQGVEEPGSPAGVHTPVDYFAGSVWDEARRRAVRVSIYMRGHGPFMPGILSPEEMEYTTKPSVLKKLKERMVDVD